MAAAVSAATSTNLAAIATPFWLIVVCPFAASSSATVACARACRCWWLPTRRGRKLLPPAPSAATV